MNNQQVHVAIAILYQQDKFLMQLRDNIPTIAAPGCWGLFGGHIEAGETPDVAVKREILEEIGYILPPFAEFGCYEDEKIVRHVFWAPLLVELNQLVLNEGWDMGLLTPQDIRQGECYSQNAGEVRPLGSDASAHYVGFHRQKSIKFHPKTRDKEDEEDLTLLI